MQSETMDREMSKTLFRAFKSKGLSLSADASKLLIRVLKHEPDQTKSLKTVLEEVLSRIEKREITSSVIQMLTIEAIIADLTTNEDDLSQESTQLFDAFTSPKVEFDERHKVYKLNLTPLNQLHGTIDCRATMYKERLILTQQRLLRSGRFIQHTIGSNQLVNAIEIAPISSLLGSKGSKLLLGMITQPEEGSWYLEDLSTNIKLDLSRCRYRSLVTEGSQVLVHGELVNGSFQVHELEFPPAEERNISLSAMGIEDIFGNGTRPQQIQRMAELEAEAQNKAFVLISDVQLDNPRVLENLARIFQGFEDDDISALPTFILMGSFISKPIRAAGGREATADAFSALADAICTCPNIAEHASILLVPGPMDVGVSAALPRRPVPELFTADLRRRVKKVTFTSNPCKLRFYTQEIVIFREDLLKKMQRNNVISQSTAADVAVDADMAEALGRTILDQGHLCPLPLQVKPVYWGLDHSLRLVVAPHLLILADRTEQSSFEYMGCRIVNPGPFASDSSFVVYRPATRTIELSRVESSRAD